MGNNNNTTSNDEQNEEIKSTNEQKEEMKSTLLDRSYGCLCGAAIGDSIGSYCEFRRHEIDKEELDKAMQMPGGGTWGARVITGQVTDDTELAVCLAHGLKKMVISHSEQKQDKQDKSKYKFDLRPIAMEYKRWIDSRPFDIGICTRQTLGASPDVREMREAAQSYNNAKKTGNQANGAMMRCMPLCIFGHQLDAQTLYALMREEASLTHANVGVYLANAGYAIMIQYLLKAQIENEKRHIQAFWEMHEHIEEVSQTADEDSDEYNGAHVLLNDWLAPFLSSKVTDYSDLSLDDLHKATQSEGWVKIAFQRCCYHLLRGSEFKQAMRSVVGEGGDTDTNACIVGGLMGAYHGLKGIPKEYVDNIKQCAPILDENRDQFQAKWYFIENMAELLIQNAPTDDSLEFMEEY